MNKNIFNLQKKKEIYEFITQNPGVYLRELSRTLNIPKTTLNYHIKYLEKYDLIKSKLIRGYKRYWAINKISRKDKELLFLLRQETPRNIIISITEYGIRSQVDLCEDLNKHSSTINFHLKKLKELDIIEQALVKNGMVQRIEKEHWMKRKSRGTEIFYRFKSMEIKLRIINLIIAHYRKKINDPLIKYFIENTSERFININLAKKFKIMINPKDAVKLIEEIFFDIFPHPYHS